MNIALWIAQILLAVVFAVSGTQKATRSREKLVASGQTGVALYPMPVVRFTAVCELLGVLGVILPWATGILPWLTVAAAGGFVIVMIGAITAHIRLREPKNIAITVTILLVSVFVIVGRSVWS
jgi:uncharacterized membrane protein YphA (DoxX/SURF4 family)